MQVPDSGTDDPPIIDVILPAGGAVAEVAVAIPTTQPIAAANIIAAALPQAIGQAAQAVASIMPWHAFGIGCSLTPSNTLAAGLQQRRERSASVPQRRNSGPTNQP